MPFAKSTIGASPSLATSLPTQRHLTASQGALQDMFPFVDPSTTFTPNWDDIWTWLGPFPKIDMTVPNDESSSSYGISHSNTAASLDDAAFTAEQSYPSVNDAFLGTQLPANIQPLTESHNLSIGHVEDGPSLHLGSQCQCLTIALNHLKALCPRHPKICAAQSLENGRRPPSTAQSLIADNERAVEAIDKILQCPSSQDGYLLTIVFLVVFKVIDCYAAAGRAVPTVSSDGILDHSHPGHGVDRCPASNLDSVGNAYVDGEENSARIAIQMILGELHHAQRLVNRLSKRFDEHKTSGGVEEAEADGFTTSGSSTDSGKSSCDGEGRKWPFSTLILYLLEEDLRRRLRTVSAGIVEMIRGL